jgi:predicted esterase
MSADDKMTNLLSEGAKLSKFIAEATALYTPKKKPVVIGASQGGDLSYFIAIRHGSLISGSFPLLATIDERIINSSFAKSASIDSYHGVDDPIVPIATAKQHIERLKKSGYTAKLHAYKGVRHDVPKRMQADYTKKINRILF